jgi:hypothetical protein
MCGETGEVRCVTYHAMTGEVGVGVQDTVGG